MTNIATANTATGQLTLESVQQAFDHWRNARGHDKKIPDYLWQQVAKIIPHYRQNQILLTLRLSHGQLHRNTSHRLTSPLPAPSPSLKPTMTAPEKPQTTDAPSPAFVKTFLPTSPESASSYHVEWQRPDGAKLTITQLDAAGLCVLVEHWRA